MVPYSKPVMRCLVLLASSLAVAQCQFRFNLGDIFGRPNRNQDQNQNQNQNNGGRVDAGAILGGLLGAVTNPNRNQNNQNQNPGNNILGGIVNAVVSEAIENTDVNIGLDNNGQLQVAVLPKDQEKENGNSGGSTDDLCVDNGPNRGSTSIRNGPNVATGDCVCWDRGFDYNGADLPIGRNPSPSGSAQECQKSCQDTNGCTHWTFKRKGNGRRGRDRAQCWRKSGGFDRRAQRNFISGPARCGPQQVSQSTGSRPTSGCTTIGGGDTGASCAFPFIYRDVEYRGCILVDADDNKPWCSTLTDRNKQHVGGQGKWGHCPPTCNIINDGGSSQPAPESAAPTVAVEGSQSQLNNVKAQLPWFPSDGKLTLPAQTVASNNIEGTTANDITNRFLALGLNQPNTAHQTCRAPGNGRGSCRHLHHCLQPVFANFFSFLTHLCIIQGRYIGVCCPESSAPQQPVTPAPTPAPTQAPTQAPPAPTRECGTNAKRFQTRIVGGRPADPDEWPWLAALVHKDGQGSGQYCGATLISDTHVLTAAHCIKPFKQSDIKVRLGEYDFDQEGETKDQTFTLASMKIHERYDDATFENDIAILKLNGVATRSESVWPICLPPASEQFTNRRAFVIGWGTIYFGGPTSSTLQEVNVRVWENSQCAANYAELDRNVLDTMLCAGETNRDSCQGDSGGPLNCMNPSTNTWELCGVVSWGARCAEPDFPGVYTRVTKYLSWIRSNSN